jgi:transcription initiation factor TFIIIB Brf1 subunit/transcription initiation factor TFIIB
MVKFKTKFTLGFSFELERVRETARIISKVLRVSKETIRTRLRKLT